MGNRRVGTFRSWVTFLLTAATLGGTAWSGSSWAQQPTPEDLTDRVTITTANERSSLDRRTRLVTSVADVTITNNSAGPLGAPLHAVIVMSSTQVEMPEALGGIDEPPYNTYYYDLSSDLGDEALSPGESVSVHLKFVRNYRVRFTYQVQVYGLAEQGPTNQPPVADAGGDQELQLQAGQTGVQVTLDGSGSHDPDGIVSGYTWVGTPAPDNVVQPSVLLGPGTHTFTLTVTDNSGDTSTPDTVTVTVLDCPRFLFYADADEDGFGDPGVSAEACTAPAGYVVDSGDCDDSLGSVHPGAMELCNGLDDNCDGATDTEFPVGEPCGVGTGACAAAGVMICAADGLDTVCDAVAGLPAEETCNTIDDDCDGVVDEGVTLTFFADNDGDGFGDPGVMVTVCTAPSGFVADGSDCDDTDPAINPGAAEVADNQSDEDCNGQDAQSPVANAGADRAVTLAGGQSEIVVQLDGSGSSDPDGTVTAFTWSGSPDPADLPNPEVALGSGQHTFTLVVTDNEGFASEPDTVTISVNPAGNGAPVFTSTPLTEAVEGLIYYYDAEVSDPEGETIRFRAPQLPPGMILWEDTGLLVWTPGESQVGDHSVELVALDPDGAQSSQTFSVSVAQRNRTPFITSTPTTTTRGGEPYAYPVAAYDPEGETLTYSLVQAPPGMAIDASTGLLQWTPPATTNSSETVAVRAADPYDYSDTQTYRLQVYDEQFALSVVAPVGAHQVLAGETLSLALTANHPEAGFSVTPLPKNAKQEGSTFTFAPTAGQEGVYRLSVTARLGDLVAQSLVTIEVDGSNTPPTFLPTAVQPFEEGKPQSFEVAATDDDGDSLTYSLTSTPPENAFFDAPQRRFHFTPSYQQAGTYTLEFAVSDGTETAVLAVPVEVVDVPLPTGVLDLVVDPPESPTFNSSTTITGSVIGETTAPAPSPTVLVTGLSPASIQQGQTVEVEITGHNTSFDTTTITADFGSGITVNALEVVSPTKARASLAADKTADLGSRSVRVTSGGTELYSIVAFSVEPGQAAVSGQILDALSQLPLEGATVSIFGTGISVQTDADGWFVLEGVPPGAQTVVVTQLNFEPVRIDLSVGVNDAIALDQPISVRGIATPPQGGGTLTRAATLGSILDRGVSSKEGAAGLEEAETVITDTLIVVGGSLVGVLDQAGNQLNPDVAGEGMFSLTPAAVENHAKALVEGGVYTLDDIITTMQALFHFPSEPLTVTLAVRGFQQAVDEAWADPTHPESAMAITLFNSGRTLSPVAPVIGPATRFNRFQTFLLFSSFIVQNYATLSISVDELLERKGVDYRDFLGCVEPNNSSRGIGGELARAPAAEPWFRSLLAGLQTLLGTTEAHAQTAPGTVTVLPPNFSAPGSRLSPERREVYAKVWQGITKDVVANAAWGTAESIIGDMVANIGIGMVMGSTGGVQGTVVGAAIGAMASVVGFGQELLMKMVTAWVAAESTVALMPTPPPITTTEFDDEGNLVIFFDRSPAEIQAKTGEGPALGFLNPDVLNFSYMLFKFPNASTVRQRDAVPVVARLTLDFDDERNFDGEYPTGRMKFVIPKHKLQEQGRHYFRIATIQYVRNRDADLVKGVASFDGNKDGHVSLAEFDGTADEFNLLDRDGNGGLDPTEFSRDPHPFTLNPLTISQILDDPMAGYPAGAELFSNAKIDLPQAFYSSELDKYVAQWEQKALQAAKTVVGKVAGELKKKVVYLGGAEEIEINNILAIKNFSDANKSEIEHTIAVVDYAENVSPGGLNDDIVSTKLGATPTASQGEAIQNISRLNQDMGVAADRVSTGNQAYQEVDGLISAHKGSPPDQIVTVEVQLLDDQGTPYTYKKDLQVSELGQAKIDIEVEIKKAQIDHINANSKKNQWKQSLIGETVPEYDGMKQTRNGDLIEVQAVRKNESNSSVEADTKVNKLKQTNRSDDSKSTYEFDPGDSYKGFDILTEITGNVTIAADNLAAFLNAIKVLKSEFSPCIVYTSGTVLERSQFPPSIVPYPNANDPGGMLRSRASSSEPKSGWIVRDYPGEEREETPLSAGFPPDFLTVDVQGRVYTVNLNSTARFGGRLFRFTPTSPAPPFALSREYVGNIMYYSLLIQFGRPANPIAMAMGPPFPITPGDPTGPRTQDLFVANYDFVDGKARILRVPVSQIDLNPAAYAAGDRSHLVGQLAAESAEFQFTGPSDMELGPNPDGSIPDWNEASAIFFSDEQRLFVLTPTTGTDDFTLRTLLDLPGRRFSGLAFDSTGKLYLADYENGQIYMMLWEDIHSLLFAGSTVWNEAEFRQRAWLMKSGLENPGDIEIEQNSLLAQRALVVSTVEGLDRFPLPLVGKLSPEAASLVTEIRIQRYLDEGRAAFLANHDNRFLIETTYDDVQRGQAELRLRYRDPADGREVWVKRTVRMATWGATVLRDLH